MRRRLSLIFHVIVKNGATLKITTSYMTLQIVLPHRCVYNYCHIPSLLSHFHSQCQTVGKKINTPTILNHFLKTCSFFEKNRDSLSLVNIQLLLYLMQYVLQYGIFSLRSFHTQTHVIFQFFFQKLINCNKWSGIQSVSTTFHLNKLFSFLHLPFIFAYFIKIPPKQMQVMSVCFFIRTKFMIQNIFFLFKNTFE